ncbi:MAG: hypothetical protein FK733_01900 [Asgard group archaeon]|nr:hypothetical protein [Asgard group archaeon]
MNIRSKNLITISLILLVLPFVMVLTLQSIDVAAESPTVSITEVTSTVDYQLDIDVEIDLPGFNYDLYTQYLRLYLNQSIDTIVTNDYDSFNSSKEFGRQDEATFTASILSPILTNGSHADSAYYNITVVAITNTDEKSTPEEWSGGYYYVDTDLPVITFISPSVALEEVWGIFTVEINALDNSNISRLQFFVDNEFEYEIVDPDSSQTNFKWDWLTSTRSRAQHTIKVKAFDASDASNKEESAFTVEVVGPEMAYTHGIPSYIDYNDTLDLNISVTDPAFNITEIKLHYGLDDVWTNNTVALNVTSYLFNYTFAEQPIGTNITWEWIITNSDGQYHVFRAPNQLPWFLLTVHWDHINPVAEVGYEKQVIVNEEVSVNLNVTENSLVDQCLIHYQIDEDDWQNSTINYSLDGGDIPDSNQTWYYFEHNFTETLDTFSQVFFYFWLNDSAGNQLLIKDAGKNYRIVIIPDDLIAPNVTIIEAPETINTNQNITITAEVNETSTLSSVILYYTVNGVQYSLNMTQTSTNTWSVSFIIFASTGAEVKIWVQAIDEFYNTGISETQTFEVESGKSGATHRNFFIALIFILLLVLPIVVTLLILRPQR